jgi:ankyrin repeat protein
LKDTFINLRKHYRVICESNRGVFPGDVGHVNIVESSYIYCEHEKNEKELQEILSVLDVSVLIQILGESVLTEKSDCIDRIVKESLKPAGEVKQQVILMQGRRRLSLRELMDIPAVNEAGLSVMEAIQAYQYTGPLFQSWNDVLRKMPFKGTSAGDRLMKQSDAAPKNRYTTSILVLVSSVLKLSHHTRIPKGRIVFRGLGRTRLGREWFNKNARGVSSGVELGFMSTTQSRAVAMEYSGFKGGELGTIFEFGVGAVDLGAQLDSLSQYPGEGEILFPPLSHLEVIGYPKVEIRDKVPVLVVSVKVNINQKAMTIDEILRRRKHTVTALIEGVENEIAFDSQIFTSNPWPEAEFKSKIQLLTARDDEFFNVDNNFKDALDEILSLKKKTIIQFVRNELKDAGPTKRENTLRDAASRGKAVIAEALVSMGVDVKCRDSDEKTKLIFAAERGHTATVTAMLRANIEAVDTDDWTDVILADLKGRMKTVTALLSLGSDVNAADIEGKTAVVYAAENGHSATVMALHELGANINAADNDGFTAVMYAAMNGHTATVTALHELGANINAAHNNGNTAVMLAALNGHTATVTALHELGAK